MQSTWQAIFDQQIAPLIGLDEAPPQHGPQLVIVGAQPGAGKSAEIARTRQSLPGAIVINGDEFRPFHPDYETFIRGDLATAAERTSDAVSFWVAQALDASRAGRHHTIIETTLRQPDVLRATLSRFAGDGYRCHLRVLIAHPEISRLGVYQRYLAACEIPGVAPRYSRRHYHDEALASQAATVQALSTDLASITFVDRTGAELERHTPPFANIAERADALRATAPMLERAASFCVEWSRILARLLQIAAPQEIAASAATEKARHCA